MRICCFAHLETLRLYVSLQSGLIALVGTALTLGHLPNVTRSVLVFAVPTIGYWAALYGSEYLDRNKDSLAKPSRPIPSGRMTDMEAFMVMLVCIAVGFVGSSYLGFVPTLISGLSLAAGAAYALSKSHGFLAPMARSLGVGLNLLFGMVAGSQFLSPGRQVFFISFVFVIFLLHGFTTSVVGQIWDVSGDRIANLATASVTAGIKVTRRISLGTIAVWQLAALVMPLWVHLHTLPYLVLAGIGMVFTIRAVTQLQVETGALAALRYLMMQRYWFSGAFLAGVLGWTAAVVVVPIFLIAYMAQHSMHFVKIYSMAPISR